MKQPFPPRRTGEVTPNSLHTPLYCRQLYIHGRALDSAAPGRLALKSVSYLGSLVFEPNLFNSRQSGDG
jgi:hypothetical protein